MSSNNNIIPVINNNFNELFNNTLKNPSTNLEYLLLDISQNIIYDISNSKCVFSEFTFNYIKLCFQYSPLINNNKGNYLYLFLTNFNHPINNCVLIKIGYTSDLIQRKKELEYNFKNPIYLLAYKIIDGEYEEKQFHKYLQHQYPYLYLPIKFKNKNYLEMYLFHSNIMNEFVKYNFKLLNNNLITLNIEHEKTLQLIEQTKHKQEDTKQITIQEETKQITVQEETKQITVQEKTKQMEIELKILELKINHKLI
jgi:hypothetical protein